MCITIGYKLLITKICIFRDEWVSGGVSDLMEDKEEPKEMFDKEDMTDMFSRAMLEKMQPELSPNIETLGDSLAENVNLEVLILKDNRIKWNAYQNFWVAL